MFRNFKILNQLLVNNNYNVTNATRNLINNINKMGYSSIAGLDSKKLKIETTKTPKPKPKEDTLIFGKESTDHMLEIDWDNENGWQDPKISPYHRLSIHPASTCLHYGIQDFEGMKAYIDNQNKIRLFRPMHNMKRLNKSNKRLFLPEFNEDELLNCIKELVKIEKDWIPKTKGYSLYIRPTTIATQESLGVAPSNRAKLFVILSPVGPYYKSGFKAVQLLADDEHVRAWPGGTGQYKIGGNYAPGILPQVEAMKKGYSQILWLIKGNDGEDYLTEVGTMNCFIFWTNEKGEKELVTPNLDGMILPGVTRTSIIELCREWKEFKVTERQVSMKEFISAHSENRLLEVFGAGTACIVSPINGISYKGTDYKIPLDPNNPEAQAGPLASRLADTIMGIQYGEIPSDWSVVVE